MISKFKHCRSKLRDDKYVHREESECYTCSTPEYVGSFLSDVSEGRGGYCDDDRVENDELLDLCEDLEHRTSGTSSTSEENTIISKHPNFREGKESSVDQIDSDTDCWFESWRGCCDFCCKWWKFLVGNILCLLLLYLFYCVFTRVCLYV